MPVRARLVVAPVLVAALWAIPTVPESRAGAQAPQSAFRAGTEVVPIDVRVVDRQGRPVRDLRREEFRVSEDGVPHALEHFSTQSFAEPGVTPMAPAPGDRPATALPAQDRRVFLIVFGHGRHQDVSNYVESLATFLRERLRPQDRVALLGWNRATDFTTDHDLAARVVDRFRDGHARIDTDLRGWFSGMRAQFGSTEIPPFVKAKIDAIFEGTTALRTRPTSPAEIVGETGIQDDVRRTTENLLRHREIQDKLANGASSLPDIVAESTAADLDLEFDQYAAEMMMSMGDLGSLYAGIAYVRHLEGEKHLVFLTQTGVRLPRQEAGASLARVASDARVAIDIIQTGGGVGIPPPRFLPLGPGGGGIQLQPWSTPAQNFAESALIQDLRQLANLTGGQLNAFRKGEDAFRRLDAAASFQYLLGYRPLRTTRDGRFRRVRVEVTRPGLTVMYRQGYFATARPVAMDRREIVTSARIEAAASHRGPVQQLVVAIGSTSVTGEGGGRQLAVDVRVDLAQIAFTRAGDYDVASLDAAIYCGDARGRSVCEARQRVDLRLTDAVRARMVAEGGVPFRLTAPLTGTPRSVKVVVFDFAGDRVGSAVGEVR